WSRRREESGGREGVQSRDRWHGLPGNRHVEVVCQLLSDIRPVAFVVLGGLRDGGPVIVKDSKSGTNCERVGEAISETNARAPVRRCIVIDLAVGRHHYVRRQRPITGYARGVPARVARRRQ